MEADYLELTDGRKVRVEWNMNSLGAFTQESGVEMTDMAEGKADVFTLRKICWFMAKEGEEIDGRNLELDEVQLGRKISQAQFIKFVQIFKKQTSTTEQKKSPRRFPTIHFRRRSVM